MDLRFRLLAASSLAIACIAPAYAQETTPPDSTAAQNEASVEQPSQGLDVVTITARRTDESLQEVPIAVSAITGDDAIKLGVTNTQALQVATPGLDFSRQAGAGGVPFIRGVGTSQGVGGNEPPNAIYIDDAYMASPNANLFSFNNIESIEVLKGPQGTLFGRNATGGVIVIRTLQPSQTSQLDVSLGYGDYDTVTGTLYANTPLTDNLAVNIAAYGKDQGEGWGRNATTGQDVYMTSEYGVRTGLRWEPGLDTTISLSADYNYSNSDIGLNNVVMPGSVAVGGATYVDDFTPLNSPNDTGVTRQYGFSLRAEHDLEAARLISISSYRHDKSHYFYDQDAGPNPAVAVDLNIFGRTFTQELQVASPSSSDIQWLTGAFYMHTEQGYDPTVIITPTSRTRLIDQQTVDSYAVFGEVTAEVFENLELTAGIRYTQDEYQLDVRRTNDLTGAVLPNGEFTQGDTFDKLTYRGIASYRFTPDIMTYLSYSRGFKSGGFNVSAPAFNSPPIQPEVLDATEIGIKSELFDRTIRLNAAAFHYDYSNLQLAIVVPGGTSILNAATARIQGIDGEIVAQIADGWTLRGGLSLIDGTYTSFPNGPVFTPNPAVCTPTPTTTGPRTGGNTACAGDLSGNDTIRTPPFTGSLGINYEGDFDFGGINVDLTYYYNDGFFWEADNRTSQPSYDLLNGSITWTTPDRKYDVRLWGRNMLDSRYYVYGVESTLRDARGVAEPRTFGVTVGAHF